jgi:AcrR family transcriptional regulator
MPRRGGSRNRHYDQRRADILERARGRLAEQGGSRASLRDLALACGISLTTLRHYFEPREDLITSVLEQYLEGGRPHLEAMAVPTEPFAISIRQAVGYTAFGFQHGVGDIYAVGLTEALRHDDLGPDFVNLILEPSMDAVRRRLEVHIARGEMREVDPKWAALSLISPVVVLMLHQRELGGSADHPIELDAFLDMHAEAFVRAYGAAASNVVR